MISIMSAVLLGANITIAIFAYLDEVPPRTVLTWIAIGAGGAGVLSGLLS
jgi:hypothetical protein